MQDLLQTGTVSCGFNASQIYQGNNVDGAETIWPVLILRESQSFIPSNNISFPPHYLYSLLLLNLQKRCYIFTKMRFDFDKRHDDAIDLSNTPDKNIVRGFPSRLRSTTNGRCFRRQVKGAPSSCKVSHSMTEVDSPPCFKRKVD